MRTLQILAALSTIFAAGFGTFGLMVRDPRRFHIAEQFSISWLCGAGVVSLSIWLFGLFLNHEALFVAVNVLCVALPLAAWKAGRSFGFRSPRRLNPFEWILLLIVVGDVLIVGYLAFAHTLGWDGLLVWEIKARYAFENSGVLPNAYFQDAGRAFSHPEYPLAIPYAELWIYLWLGESTQFWAKLIFPIFYLSGVILLVAISARLTGKLWTGLVAAIVLSLIPQITVQPGSAVVGYADFPLSVFYLAACGYLLCATTSDHADFLRIFAACLACLPWLKREGAILWVIAAGCGAFAIWHAKKSPKWFGILLPGLCVIVGWRIYLQQLQATTAADFAPVNFATLSANIHRLVPILSALAAELTNTDNWGLFWLIAAVAAVYVVRQYRDARSVIFVTAVTVPLTLYALIYLFSGWTDYQRHLELSLCRLLMHITPFACLGLPAVLASLRQKFYRSPQETQVRTAACEEPYPERTPEIDFA